MADEGRGRSLQGLQILKLILNEFRTNEELNRYNSAIDVEKLAWCGDQPGELKKFLNNLDELRSNLSPDFPKRELTTVVLDRMENSKLLEVKIDRFKERYKPNNPKRTLKRLLAIIQKHLDLKLEKENDKKKKDMFGNKQAGRGLPAIAGSEEGKAMKAAATGAVCFKFLKGQCNLSAKDCPYVHPSGQEGVLIKGGKGDGGGKSSKGGKKGKGDGKRSSSKGSKSSKGGKKGGKSGGKGGKSKKGKKDRGRSGSEQGSEGRSRSPSAERKQECFKWKRGECRLGRACQYWHDQQYQSLNDKNLSLIHISEPTRR